MCVGGKRGIFRIIFQLNFASKTLDGPFSVVSQHLLNKMVPYLVISILEDALIKTHLLIKAMNKL